jgi:small subunit ribosomal protein S6
MSTHRQYELVYIVSPDASEQEVNDLHAQVEAAIAKLGGGRVKTEDWGRRKMAYEIGPHKEGA